MPRYSSRVRSYSPSTSGVTSELGIVWSSSGGHTHDGVESSLINGESYSLFDFRPTNRVSTIDRSNIQERNREALKSFIVNTIKEDYIEFNNILLGPDVIGAQNIVAGSINSDLIAANTIVANNIAANTITTELLATDAVQSLNYDAPDGAEVYSDAGSFLDLSNGEFITPGLRLYSNGDLYISNSVVIGGTTANTIVDGAAAGANAIPTGGAATDVNNGGTTIEGTKITANSITTSQIATDAIKSGNYDGPDSGEVFSDAGTFLDLSGGNFISRGFAAYSNGSVYISSSATIGSTTASTVVSGAASGANSVQIGGAASDVNSGTTNISGGKVRTGEIESTGFSWNGSSTFSTTGTRIDLDDGQIIGKQLRIDSSGNATFAGSISGATISIGSGNDIFRVDSDGDMWIGHATQSSAEFQVTKAGALTASSANITGTINATGGTFSGDINVTGSLIAPTLKLGTSSPDSNVRITLGANFNSGISINGGYGSILVGKLLGPAGGEGNDYYGFAEHHFSVSNSGGNTETTMFLTTRDTPSYIDIRPLQPPITYTNAQFQIRFNGVSRLGANSNALFISRQSTTSGIGFADIGFGGVGTYSSRRELKENIKDVLASESIERIRKLRPVEFTFKADAVNQELAPFNLRRGFIAEEMAEVSHEMAEWSWVDKDDAYQLAGFPNPETDENGNIIRSSQQIIDEDYPLESAVPSYWNHDAVIADCVNAIKYILSVIGE